jgi:hypothetical protein
MDWLQFLHQELDVMQSDCVWGPFTGMRERLTESGKLIKGFNLLSSNDINPMSNWDTEEMNAMTAFQSLLHDLDQFADQDLCLSFVNSNLYDQCQEIALCHALLGTQTAVQYMKQEMSNWRSVERMPWLSSNLWSY